MSAYSIRHLAVSLGLAVFSASAPASAAVSDFVGSWANTDPAARGITRIEIRSDGTQALVRVWGQCHPRDCDWGEQPAHLFSPNVGVPIEAGANAATVEFDKQGANTMLVLTGAGGGSLSFRAFTLFTDASARSDYDNSGHLSRQ